MNFRTVGIIRRGLRRGESGQAFAELTVSLIAILAAFVGFLLVAALSFVATLHPFWTWNAAQKFLPMSVLGVTAYFIPVITLALAFVTLGEPSTALQLVGTLLVIASATIETRRH